jgi:hypothetical protein|tara:strand:+ start:41 stop:553 length:513 start_codon:yes stop_codon:yes gene_type:complete
MVIAKRIKQDKTRNFAVVGNTRTNTSGDRQKFFPRVNKKVVIETLSIPIPIYVNLDYKIIVKTEYQQQMNDLTQPFMTRTGQINSFIMRRNGHLYEAFIDQGFAQSNNVANLGEDERQFTSEVSIKVLGYLIGEGKSDDRPIVTKEESVVEITFPRETIVPAGNDNFLMD